MAYTVAFAPGLKSSGREDWAQGKAEGDLTQKNCYRSGGTGLPDSPG
jgi:hypothetical protein